MEYELEIMAKLPPQAVEVEKVVLGALLIQSDAIFSITDILTSDCFYKPEHQIIYSVIFAMGSKFVPIDLITVSNELKKIDKLDEIGGDAYLVELTDNVATSGHIDYHAKIVYEKYIKRSLNNLSVKINNMAHDNNINIDETVDFIQNQVMDITVNDLRSEPEKASVIFERVANEIEYKQLNPDKIGIPSGFNGLTWYNGDLIITAGRSSMGKTWIGCVKFASEAISYKIPTLIFSLEMTKLQIMHRFIALNSGVGSNDIRDGSKTMDWSSIEKSGAYFSDAPLYIDDNGGLSVFQLVAKARKMKVKHGIKLIIVDYIQLLSALTQNTKTKDQEVGLITKALKSLAKELDIPVIAISQLNRSVEQRQDKRPLMSDLRDSGNIEQDADMVLMVYRQFYYTNDIADAGKGELIKRKDRNGGLQNFDFYHNRDWTKIEQYSIGEKWEEEVKFYNEPIEKDEF